MQLAFFLNLSIQIYFERGASKLATLSPFSILPSIEQCKKNPIDAPNVFLWRQPKNFMFAFIVVIASLVSKLSWSGDGEGAFRSLSQTTTFIPVYHTHWRLYTVPFYCGTLSGEAVKINF